MRYPRKPLFFFLSFILIITACQKNNSTTGPDNPPPSPTSYDSTQLVKSITLSWGEPDNRNTMTENYSYDTVNRKLTIDMLSTGQNAPAIYPSGTREVISYNSGNLVTHVDITYPDGTTSDPYNYQSGDMAYDGEGVIKKLTTTTFNGDKQETAFTKQTLSSGYQLIWSSDDGNTILQRKAAFDNAGNNILNSLVYPDGFFTIDSLIYDNNKNVSQVYTKTPDSTYLHYNFKSRISTADQLYKQRQLIMNGIANIPFTDNDNNGTVELFGLLSLYISNENWQYTRCPYQSVTAFNSYQNKYVDLSSDYETDAKGRLIRFRIYEEDLTFLPSDFVISYYK